ncbi:hypothetical protein TRFO_35902 [Tritrichomonas foetus]|uniref:UvrD-like helicase ATP-binding domain-containing protein n=1 Tax=Tritrichomonas foetus TaxID=1144522 RepID=A0A1J4JKK0_9EUKA|nr:hypothetical protein TRFO_35902 [Tritrichomonas foetus]|eukprot:OHS97772.1 hypothetical protein TRFO_35902 [Tritrichomonas foetus]
MEFSADINEAGKEQLQTSCNECSTIHDLTTFQQTNSIKKLIFYILNQGYRPKDILVLVKSEESLLSIQKLLKKILKNSKYDCFNSDYSFFSIYSFGFFMESIFQEFKYLLNYKPLKIINQKEQNQIFREVSNKIVFNDHFLINNILKSNFWNENQEDDRMKNDFFTELVNFKTKTRKSLKLNTKLSSKSESKYEKLFLAYQNELQEKQIIDYQDLSILILNLFTMNKEIVTFLKRKHQFLLIENKFDGFFDFNFTKIINILFFNESHNINQKFMWNDNKNTEYNQSFLNFGYNYCNIHDEINVTSDCDTYSDSNCQSDSNENLLNFNNNFNDMNNSMICNYEKSVINNQENLCTNEKSSYTKDFSPQFNMNHSHYLTFEYPKKFYYLDFENDENLPKMPALDLNDISDSFFHSFEDESSSGDDGNFSKTNIENETVHIMRSGSKLSRKNRRNSYYGQNHFIILTLYCKKETKKFLSDDDQDV